MTPEQLAKAIWEGGTGIRFSWQYIDPGVRALKIASARRMLAADDLLAAAKLLKKAEDFHANCDACAPEDAPESCALCFPHFDAARIARRVAIAKAEGTGL